MRFANRSRLLTLTSLIGLCVFAGDIVTDSIADLRGDHCVSQNSQPGSQGEQAPCGHCACAVHNGNIIASTFAVDVGGVFAASVLLPIGEQSAPDGLPAAIDHPPQLA